MRTVDHVIVGAGLAGLTAAHFLDAEVVLIDPNPFGYKIGESFIPEVFRHPKMAELIPAVRALESTTVKHGTTFIGPESVVDFPLPEDEQLLAMHCYRPDLEAMLGAEWGLDIVRARVTSIDLEKREVQTTAGTFRCRKQILDCSGPAMVLASLIGEIDEVLEVHTRWRYFDVEAIDDEGFADSVRSSGKRLERLDPRHGISIDEAGAKPWAPSHTTVLTWVKDGVWCWQIPIFKRRVLSFGVVSRHGPVSEEEYDAVVREFTVGSFRLSDRTPSDHPLDRVHTRGGFARKARTAATEDYILLSDAFAFSDPVYSVGTGFAVNQAIEVSDRLNSGVWDAETAKEFSDRSDFLHERARHAFDLWYAGEVTMDDDAAEEVQECMLRGGLFRDSVARQYGNLLNDSDIESAGDPFHPLAGVRPIAAENLPTIDVGTASVVGAVLCVGGLRIDIAREEHIFALLVAPDEGGPSYTSVQGLSLSYRDDGRLQGENLDVLVSGVAASLAAHATAWRALLD